MDESTPETEIRIFIQLPQPIDSISKVLNALADIWPNAKIDTGTPGGWTITLAPEEL